MRRDLVIIAAVVAIVTVNVPTAVLASQPDEDVCVVKSRNNGKPRRIQCGELQLYAVSPAYVAKATKWRSKAERFPDLVRELSVSRAQVDDLEAAFQLASDDLVACFAQECVAAAPEGWSALEVVGASLLTGGAGLVVGWILGVLSF